MVSERQRKALVVGGGPVGALTALSLHRRGWEVELWEGRDDPRGKDERITNLRSINLAISSRGLEALRSVDPSLVEQFMDEAIPMKGRMIHPTTGAPQSQIYDPIRGQCINSISRPILNQRLLESLPEAIDTVFDVKLAKIDWKTRTAYGLVKRQKPKQKLPGQEDDDGKVGGGSRGEGSRDAGRDEIATQFDLIVGCDGSWSKVRSEMMRVDRIDFSQSFIPHAYIELHMPADPTKPGGFAIDPNHLHIWPRHDFMLIGLPNKDGSFTLTLFLPFSALESIKTRTDATNFFRQHFPSALDIVGDRLIDDFENNPRGNLVTINLTPAAWSSHALLLGDSSHSMVPFYGQGLNCGLEDVRVLNSYLERHSISATTRTKLGETDDELARALGEYSTERHKDLLAICELALQNYTEMRSTVLSPLHHLRRTLDSLLAKLIPSTPTATLSLTSPFPTTTVKGWTSLYEMVTFRPDVGYGEALRRERWQRGVINWASWTTGVGAIAGLGGVGVWAAQRWFKRR